ncbi:tRNA lysidine(34) synthetase TilS [Halochromatium glycolicum]|uniref:tRNA(Ile)-lysidine synthase n=1 Tax=Halochromatium glycolicum TaxID=85075 RepID=A0AAJ0U6P3_9GAMM|nr:tRNA lysidine(34) synthetase TilS [Halochromatium glycolicum]MBK1706289.1 tRNA lysidine(34) synthetase TilS [Halochromatium glycolicum]
MAAFSVEVLRSELERWPFPARLWLAFSGGLDSHVLLHACSRLREPLSLRLHAIHVDHGLHPASGDWSNHCRAVCAGLDVPFTGRRVQVSRRPGESLEAVAREVRYRVLAEVLTPGDTLMTAQHLDDQAETLLLALLRGSGVHGLAAMPQSAPLGSGTLLRPLLGIERDALLAYAREHHLCWLDDPANETLAFDRNRLRSRVLPLLRERWPAAARTIARSAGHCADAAQTLDEWADAQLPAVAGGRPSALSVAGLAALQPRQARLLLRRWLTARGFLAPSTVLLRRILDEVLGARADATPLVAWPGCEVRRYRDDLFALVPLPPPPAVALDWVEGHKLELPSGLGWLEAPQAPLPPLQVRFGEPGRLCAAEARPRRPLTKLFQEAGIPSWLRPLVPLLVDPAGALRLVPGVCGCGLSKTAVRWRGHPWEGFGWFD